MEDVILTTSVLRRFQHYLRTEEKSEATIRKYMHDVQTLANYLNGSALEGKETLLAFKGALLEKKYAVSSINSMLAAVNTLAAFLGRPDWKVRFLRQQRELFYQKEKELTREEYLRLVRAAQDRGDERTALLLQTICATGIRVSELRAVTVAALHSGQAQILCKGKARRIVLPKVLCVRLLAYCRGRGIAAGCVFVTKAGNPMDRSNIWALMKRICRAAGVAQQKVFPHNLRHLFARTFYRQYRDIVRLADILGHSSVNTTRIYTATPLAEHRGQIAHLKLLI